METSKEKRLGEIERSQRIYYSQNIVLFNLYISLLNIFIGLQVIISVYNQLLQTIIDLLEYIRIKFSKSRLVYSSSGPKKRLALIREKKRKEKKERDSII